MTTFSDLHARLRAAVAALTPRERASIAIATAVGAVLAVTAVLDWSLLAQGAARDVTRDVARANAVVGRDSNRGFQEGVALAAQSVADSAISEASEGVAQARAASALRTMAETAGLSDVAITAVESAAQPAANTISPLAMTLSGDFTWSTFTSLLGALAASDIAFAVEAIDVRAADDGAQTFTMTVRAPFLRQAPQS